MVRMIIAPLLGGIIGYMTNDIAIKMLFRPRRAVYIGRWHIPFTPGLIPQQKDRIAASIGSVISTQLLNSSTLKAAFLSENTKNVIRNTVAAKLKNCSTDARTIEELLGNQIGTRQMEDCMEKLNEQGTKLFTEKLMAADIGSGIIRYVMDPVKEKLRSGFMAAFLDDSLLHGLETKLSEVINEKIREKAPEIIRSELEKMEHDLFDMKICDVYDRYEERIPQITESVVSIYGDIVNKNVDSALEAIDLGKIVEEKVQSFDALQLEQMIFGIMKKELSAIVYLGALLGFLMGFINLLF